MARWEADARGRLAVAALELYAEHGFEQTTVADIAERAGVTERTFFRHFADKREVLFDGSARLQEAVVGAVAAAPAGAPPLGVATAAFERSADVLGDRHAHARRRSAVIAATPSLQERELLKMSVLGAAVADALRARGVPDPAAALAAEAGVSAFRVGFEAWIVADGPDDLAGRVRAAAAQLRALAGGA